MCRNCSAVFQIATERFGKSFYETAKGLTPNCSRLFVTLFYGQLNPATGDMTCVNAGHNPPLFYRRVSDTLEQLMPTGIPAGIDEDFACQQDKITLEPGDVLASYSDGVTEAINHDEEDFGMERLEQVVLANKQASAENLVAAVEKAVIDFSPAGKQFDDITIVVVRRNRK